MRISLFFLMCVNLCFASTYWDEKLVRAYTHNSELQRRWAMSFLAPHLKELDGNERVLDIGCGDGKISADVSRFLPKGSVVGIDPSPWMIGWAKMQYCSMEYPNLTFQDGEFLAVGQEGSFDRVISFCALQHCPDQAKALKNVKELLKPGGKVLILVPALNNPAWSQARAMVQSRPKWADYWKGFAPRKFLSVDQYVELLKDFKEVKVELIHTMDPFIDQKEIVDWLLGTFAPVVPPTEAREFYEEWIEEYLRLDPEALSSDGVIFAKLGIITISGS